MKGGIVSIALWTAEATDALDKLYDFIREKEILTSLYDSIKSNGVSLFDMFGIKEELSLDYFVENEQAKLLTALLNYKRNILLIRCSADFVITSRVTDKIISSLSDNNKFEAITINGEDHGFKSFNNDDEIKAESIDTIEKNLN